MLRLIRFLVKTLAQGYRRVPARATADWTLPSDYLDIEQTQIRHHRAAVDLRREIPLDQVPGLAISGGGIRSAVFSLGVLQTLADQNKLRHFSYISTVSGGTYLGAFYGSLFMPDELRQGANQLPDKAFADVAKSASDRLRPKRSPDNPGAVTPIEYLRDNCNYLIPNGMDDALQSIAFAARNWFALQYVIGVSILTIILWLNWFEAISGIRDVLSRTVNEFWLTIWFSSSADMGWTAAAALAIATATFILSPVSRAYWLTQNLAQDMRLRSKVLPLLTYACVDVLAAFAIYVIHRKENYDGWLYAANWSISQKAVIVFAWLTFATQILAIIYFCLAWDYASRDKSSSKRWFQGAVSTVAKASDSRPFVDRVRNALTNAYTNPFSVGGYSLLVGPFQLFLYLIAAVIVDGGGAYLHSLMSSDAASAPKAIGPGLLAVLGTVGGAVWTAGRFLLAKGDALETAAKRIPKIILASIAALVATLCTLGFWSTVAHTILSYVSSVEANQTWLWRTARGSPAWRTQIPLTFVCVVMLLIAIIDGLCIQFLNLSTYQRFYSTRLTRAFLGATNRTRLDDASERDVTSLVAGDSISMTQYYNRSSHAPVHLINATINKTVDWNSSLVHRGARGLSLSVGPAGMTIGAKLGVLRCYWQEANDISTPAVHVRDKVKTPGIWLESLTLGDWIAISGAAVSTGLGNKTQAGYSLLLGIANVRLGYWWDTYSAPFRDGAQAFRRSRVPVPTDSEPPHIFRDLLFGTQCCLQNELLGRFDGPRARRWYLTDGGHFDNTGAYELLRRGLKFVVILDNGADEKFKFADVAILIRLVRVDFGIEITTRDDVPEQPCCFEIDFNYVALSFHEFGKRPECVAIRLITTFPDGTKGQILLIKPRLTTLAPYDVWEYSNEMKTFPHETTANQFFNDVQWECHRALGESQARTLFGTRSS